MKALKIRACDVMHLRAAGKLSFRKQGSAFLYSAESVLKQKQQVMNFHLRFQNHCLKSTSFRLLATPELVGVFFQSLLF